MVRAHKIQIVISIIAIGTLLSTCCNNKDSQGHDLVGTWKSHNGAQITLKSDGTFAGISLPSELFFNSTSRKVEKRTFAGFGRWKIVKWRFQFPTVELDFDSTDIHILLSSELYVHGSGFWEDSPPWDTLFQWKEEEGGNRYKFIRQ